MDLLKNLLEKKLKNVKDIDVEKTKKIWAKKIGRMVKNSEILFAYKQLIKKKKIKKNLDLEKKLKVRKVRTLSGVAPFAVMTKPYLCPGSCIYCVKEKGMPKSYMSDEPAAARAKKLNFDPQAQIIARLNQLKKTGHNPEKLEIIIIGGSFSAYPNAYKKSFIKTIYDTCNNAEFLLKQKNKNNLTLKLTEESQDQSSEPIKTPKTINESQKNNQTAKYRIVGLSIETRPDLINIEEIKLMRQLGITRIQLGVQAFDNNILQKIKRGHDLKHVEKATLLLRNSGFKVNYHFMPNLPGSNPQKDFQMVKTMFSDIRYKPDTLKIYPCIVLPGTELEKLYQQGKYQSYDDHTLMNLIIKIKKIIPQYCRIDRLVRDITKNWTVSGTKKTNMRQLILEKMQTQNLKCHCIRCREVRNQLLLNDIVKYKILKYKTFGGDEYFLSYDSEDEKLYAMLRLRLPLLCHSELVSGSQKKVKKPIFPILKNSALVREVHVFGQQLEISKENFFSPQHQSYGRKLIKKAEEIAKKNNYKKIAIISGVGVREYYKKLGYRLKDTYMMKSL